MEALLKSTTGVANTAVGAFSGVRQNASGNNHSRATSMVQSKAEVRPVGPIKP
jgi:hypothetical protein